MNLSDLDLLIPQPVLESEVKPRWGTVTALSPLRVKLDGDAAQLPVTPSPLVAGLAVNDRVWTVLVGRQIVVCGVYGGKAFPDLTPYALTANLPVPEKITRVTLGSGNVDTGLDVWTVIPWSVEVFDDAGAWASGAPTKIVTPSGFTRVKLTLYTAWTASTTQPGRFTRIERSYGNPLALSNRRELFESAETITTGWISTTAGDEFNAAANSHGSGADLLGSGSWGGPCWFEATFRA